LSLPGHKLTRAPWLAPAAVLALALLPRLWQIDMTRFFNDQVLHIASATSFIDTGRLPLSSGFTFHIDDVQIPPLVTFLLTPAALISRNPVWVSAYVAVFDALTALLVYRLGKRVGGSTFAGLAAGILYALNPTAITSGRTIWNPNFVPFFAAAGLLGLVEFALRARSHWLATSLLSIGCAAQLHVVNAIFLPFWALIAITKRQKVRLRPIAAAAALLLLTIAPYLYLQTQTGWADAIKLLRYTTMPKLADLTGIDAALQMAGPAMFRWLLPAPGDSLSSLLYDPLTWLLVALALLGLAGSWREPKPARAIIGGWLVLPILASVRHTNDVAPHYLLAMLPALTVLQGLGLEDAWRFLQTRLPRMAHSLPAAAGLPACALLALGIPLAVDYAHFQARVGTNVRQVEYGMPLRYSMAAADALRSVPASEPLYLGVPFLFNQTVPYLAGRRSYQWYWDRQAFIFPQQAAWYLIQNDSFGHDLLTDYFGPPAATVPSAAGLPEFSLFKMADSAQHSLFSGSEFFGLDGEFGQAIRLEGYRAGALAAGQQSRVLLSWRILDAGKVPGHLSQFTHLVDDAGRTVSTDQDLWDIREPWRNEDSVATAFDLAIRPETPTAGYWLETGFYSTFDGKPLGAPLRIGPLKVAGSTPPAGSVASPPMATLGDAEIGLLQANWQGQDVVVDWDALRKPRASYTVFVHALDGAGKLVGQWDGLPRNGGYPTTLWDAGETVHDVYHLGLAPAAGLHLEIGMYTQPDVKRLAVRVTGSAAAADHVTVQPAGESTGPSLRSG